MKSAAAETAGLRTGRKTFGCFLLSPHSSILASGRRGGFTLIEVLAALVLMALVLPTVMEGITMASSLADMGRRRTEAAGLAQTYLANAVASQTWENGNLSGDCGPDWPGFSWEANVAPWPGDTAGAGLSEIDLTVTYNGNVRRKVAVTVSTLVYARSTATNPTNTSTNGL